MDIELTQAQEEEIVAAGIEFIRVLTEQLGPERGQEAWETISSALGNDIKGKIFFAMLTGDHPRRITLQGRRNSQRLNDKIEVIKVIREYTGLGLKNAKDVADNVEWGHNQFIEVMHPGSAMACRVRLRRLGIDC
jgi:hypothetical protein